MMLKNQNKESIFHPSLYNNSQVLRDYNKKSTHSKQLWSCRWCPRFYSRNFWE